MQIEHRRTASWIEQAAQASAIPWDEQMVDEEESIACLPSFVHILIFHLIALVVLRYSVGVSA